MRRRALALLPLLALGPVVSCGEPPTDTVGDALCQRLLDEPASQDVFDWLKTSPLSKKPGAMSTEEALALAHRLEQAGAVRLTAVRIRKADSPVLKREESLGMVVTLPDDPR